MLMAFLSFSIFFGMFIFEESDGNFQVAHQKLQNMLNFGLGCVTYDAIMQNTGTLPKLYSC